MTDYVLGLYKHLSLDEKANVVTHAIGLILTLLDTPFLLCHVDDSVHFIGLAIFSFGVCFMFLCSTLYHLANKDIAKNRWRILDHISIFILIGSTYTPFILYYLPTKAGFSFLLLHWIIIVVGITFKLIFKTKYEIFSLILYLVLGWMVMFIYDDITANMSRTVLFWLISGGISYTIGVYFYIKTHLAWHHAIWHIFVMLGCLSHWIALYKS